MDNEDRLPIWATVLLVVLVCIGLHLRYLHLVEWRWAWVDECLLGFEIWERSYLALAVHEGIQQVAPVGYKWLLKTLALVTGSYGEVVLRAPALVAGSGLLVGTAALAPRLLRPWGAVTAVGLVAASPLLVYYSWEIKPYALEAALVPTLLALALAPVGEGWRRPLPRALVAASITPWFALTSVFLLPGLLADAWAQDDQRWSPQVRRALAMLAVSAALCIAWYLCLDKGFRSYLFHFWASVIQSFPPPDPSIEGTGGWLLTRLQGCFEWLVASRSWWPVSAGLALVGLVHLARDRPRVFRYLVSALSLWFLAGLLRIYPIPASLYSRGNRLSVHAIPILALLIGAGVSALERPWIRVAAPVLGGIVLLASWRHLPAQYCEERPAHAAYAYLFENYQEGDAVALAHPDYQSWQYFAGMGRVSGGLAKRFFMGSAYAPAHPALPLDMPPATRRVWWYGGKKPPLDTARMEEQLAAGYELAPTQPPVPDLQLWLAKPPQEDP
jgi:hypothetical protein